MGKSIELIGTMVLNGGQDLLKQYKCIDHPVKRYVVIDNSEGKNKDVTDAIDQLQKCPSPFIDELVIIRNRQNVGFSGSINQIIKQNSDKPYWFVMSSDWHPRPGELARLASRLESPFIGLKCDPTQNAYSAIVFTPEIIRMAGLMDENFYPAYYEDNDYNYRLSLASITLELFELKYDHKVSSTLHSKPEYLSKNTETFQRNFDYYVRKWGGPPGAERYFSPFDIGATIDYYPYDPGRVEKQKWQ